ncbi:MAG TPA: PHP-associated domain-containing protein [Candidatus Hydrogenedentes bacterium]|nr:PHP-associated domain-containing protein [Candidatus Hydrogenedentota bacterium]HOL75918.1 PHP-associated domain-containing protein [Candidatus Hydrogenedentota bacterium]HPO85673.1 PHP-associated domain-containing protein [Candidatus Hydrogenedentota bacterium]
MSDRSFDKREAVLLSEEYGLKADFHTHASDDPAETLSYSSEMLIRQAADRGIDVLSIVGHGSMVFTDRLGEYAENHGVLLVPGVELSIEGKHVLLLNPNREQLTVKTFADLRSCKGCDEVVVAPHPFYPSPHSLGRELIRHIELFDAIELCAFHMPFLRCNERAKKVAERFRKPMIATTDTHTLPYAPRAYTLVRSKRDVCSILEAIRHMRITPKVEQPSMVAAYAAVFRMLRCNLKDSFCRISKER